MTRDRMIYKKRPGTAGLSGQLYETKLLMFLLHRALNSKNIKVEKFCLGSNVEGIGVFDDIVLSYQTRGRDKPRVIFVQCKHRENPGNRPVSRKEMIKKDGNFSIHQLYYSYLLIRHLFGSRNDDDIVFREKFENVDGEFVVYTPEEVNPGSGVKELAADENDILFTKGKIFQCQNNNETAKILLRCLSEWRAERLGKQFACFVLSGDGSDIMEDDLIRQFHVLLAQEVLQVSEVNEKGNRSVKLRHLDQLMNDKDVILMFRNALYKDIFDKSIFHSNESMSLFDELSKYLHIDKINELKIKHGMKEVVISELKKEMMKLKVTEETINEIIIKIKLESLEVPDMFGNVDFKVKENNLISLSNQIMNILLLNRNGENAYVVKIHDTHFDPEGVFEGDLKINEDIGGLVGNLLVLDKQTEMLKINVDECSLPKNASKLLLALKNNCLLISNADLSNYRFQFNITGFPRMSWVDEECDKELLQDFLNKFKFYSSQAKEDEVEKIVKNEMNSLSRTNNNKNYRFRINNEARFLKVHDEVQKWWMQSGLVPYITETCKVFDEVDKNIIESGLLTLLTFVYTRDICNNDFKYNPIAVQSLKLDNFIEEPNAQILKIITESHLLTSIKLLQYFQDGFNGKYSFIDLEYTINDGLFKEVLEELAGTQLDILITTCSTDEEQQCTLLCKQIQQKNTKVILLTNTLTKVYFDKYKCMEQIDNDNEFIHLTEASQKTLLNRVKVLFQEEEINLNIIIEEACKHLINASMLSKLINVKQLKIGKELNDRNYDRIKDFYVNRRLNHPKINQEFINDYGKLDKELLTELFVTYNGEITESSLKDYKDILLVSNEETLFKRICDNYKQSIHWFKEENKEFIWKKSRGSIVVIRKYLDEISSNTKSISPITLSDVEDKTVIIAAAPGTGKSSMLTHLAINTKKKNPSSWIIRINLLDHSSEFRKWQERTTKVDKIDVIKFLYRAVGFHLFDKEQDKIKREKNISEILQLIALNDHDEVTLKNTPWPNMKDISVLEIELFNCFYNNGNVVLLCDGFDEISPDYKEQTIKLFNIIRNIKIKQLWITTRPYNIQSELENELGIFSYALGPFSETDQIVFLRRYCNTVPELRALDSVRLLSTFHTLIGYNDVDFFTLPLNMYMIAKIFKDIFMNDPNCLIKTWNVYMIDNKYSDKFNLVNLYGQFINMKINDIQLTEKSRFLNKDDPYVKNIFDVMYKEAMKNHKILAVGALFGKEKILSDTEEATLQSLIERVERGEEKTGIVECVVDGVPVFIHRTFAEYIVVEFFSDKLKFSSVLENIWDLFLNRLLVEDGCQNIRRFFEYKLAYDGHLCDQLSNNEVAFKLLLRQNKAASLYTAVEEGLSNIIQCWLNIVEKQLNEDNLNCFAEIVMRLCLGKRNFFRKYHKRNNLGCTMFIIKILHCIKKKTSDKFKYFDVFYANILQIAICLNANEIINTLFNDIINNNHEMVATLTTVRVIDKHFYPSIAHDLNRTTFVILSSYLAKLDREQLMLVVSATDSKGRTPIHCIVGRGDFAFSFFDFLKKNLLHDDFRQICLKRDKLNKILIDNLKMLSYYEKQYLALWQDVIPSDDEVQVLLSEDLLRDIYKVISGNLSLFETLQNKHKIFCKNMFSYLENVGTNNDDFKYLKTILINAIKVNNKVLINALHKNIQSTDQFVDIVTTRYNESTVMHLYARHSNVDTLLPYLDKMDGAQLMLVLNLINSGGKTPAHYLASNKQINILITYFKKMNNTQIMLVLSITDNAGRTIAHYAAEKKDFDLFNFLKICLDKQDFRQVCFTRNKRNDTPIAKLCKSNDPTFIKLCDYIFSDEYDSVDDNLREIIKYMSLQQIEMLFDEWKNGNNNSLITKVLQYLEGLFNSNDTIDYKLGDRLLRSAVVNENRIIVEAILKNVNNTDQFFKIVTIKHNKLTTLHYLATDENVNIVSPYLGRADTAQLMRAVNISIRGYTPAIYAVERGNFAFLYIIKMRLTKQEFRDCFLTSFNLSVINKLFEVIKCDNDRKDIEGCVYELIEYILPSDDEDQNDLSFKVLTDICLAVRSELFFKFISTNKKQLLNKILDCLKQLYCRRERKALMHLLLENAVRTNNELFVDALLKDVRNPNQIEAILLKMNILSETVLSISVQCQNLFILSNYLDKLSEQQLLTVLRGTDYMNRPIPLIAAEKGYSDFFYYCHKQLSVFTFGVVINHKSRKGETVMSCLCRTIESRSDPVEQAQLSALEAWLRVKQIT